MYVTITKEDIKLLAKILYEYWMRRKLGFDEGDPIEIVNLAQKLKIIINTFRTIEEL